MRIAVAGSNDYAAPATIRTAVSRIPADATLILTAYCGVNRVAREIADARCLRIEQIRWDCKPGRVLAASPSAILIFHDGANTYLLDLARAAHAAHVPLQLFGVDGKSLDYRAVLCLTPSNKTTPRSNAAMPIIDAAIDLAKESFSTRVKATLTVPSPVYDRYERQGKSEGVTAEKAMEDRLRRCADHNGTRSLYFTDAQRNELERITGHLISDAASALTQIRTVCQVKINGVDVVLPERVLQRAAARAKSCRMAPDAWIAREIIQSMERATGLRPY